MPSPATNDHPWIIKIPQKQLKPPETRSKMLILFVFLTSIATICGALDPLVEDIIATTIAPRNITAMPASVDGSKF